MPLQNTIPGVLIAAAQAHPDKIAVENEDGSSLTLGQLLHESRRAAAAFIAYGMRPGERIAVWAPNSTEWIIATIGVQMIEGVMVPLNTRLKGREAAYIMDRSSARLLFTVRDFLKTDYPALLADENLPKLERTVILDASGSPDESWEKFLELGKSVPAEAIDAAFAKLKDDDVSDILFTSGTTGKPKGALSTHYQTVVTSRSWVNAIGLNDSDRYLIVNPFFHSFGYKSGWLACLIAGATILPQAVFEAEAVLRRIANDRITVLPGAPTLYQSMLVSPVLKTTDLSSLRMAITGAAVVPRQLVERMHSELGFKIVLTGYGLTESSGTVTICDAGDSIERVSQTSGKAIPGLELRSVDPQGKDVPPGEPGEILVRGFNIVQGYLDDPKATAEAIDADGWFRTGDIGIIDADGYIRITDRAKDMFIVGGFNCYPAETEGLLLEHPAIAQVAVVGVPDERMGEVAKAFVILRPGATLTEAELIAWARKAMANYKVPRYVEFVDRLPTTASGKVQRFQLRG
ncbi:MAG: fatty acid--CoA ligase [Rhodospirillales bacterium]|nr:fatty acid--CoA ligase [Rhodospirillales bacterium]